MRCIGVGYVPDVENVTVLLIRGFCCLTECWSLRNQTTQYTNTSIWRTVQILLASAYSVSAVGVDSIHTRLNCRMMIKTFALVISNSILYC